MAQADIPVDTLTDTELLREIAGNLRYLRRLLTEYEPLLPAIRRAANGDAVAAAGLRRAIRRGARNG